MNAENLKKSILQLAIQGKIVEQREEEGSGHELVKQIKLEKEELVKRNLIRKEKPLAVISKDEIPYEIPKNWEWIRFGDLGSYKKGPFGSDLKKSMFVPKSLNTVKVYEQQNAIQKSVNVGDYYIERDYFEEKMKGFELAPGDIIVSCAGTIGETYVMPEKFEKGIINQALMRMKIMPSINTEYFLLYFDFILKKQAQQSSKGSAIKNIPPFKELKNYLVPLPPIQEQERIVAKIDELMIYVENYGDAFNKLSRLNKNFPIEMNKSIIQYAIQGKLVEQREEEDTAEELYKRIQLEKEKLIKSGEIKREKKLSEISEEEVPFQIPYTWKWTKLGDIVNFNLGRTPPRSQEKYWGEGYPWVSIKDMIDGGYTIETKEQVSELGLKERFKQKLIPKGTLLMSFKLTIGKVTILGTDAVHNEAIISVIPFYDNHKIFRDFLLKVLPFMAVFGDSRSAIKGNTLNKTSLNNLLIPLPPLGEQKRIVTRIEELLECTQKLKEGL